MELRELGRTGLRISAIGFGAWAAGGVDMRDGLAFGWSGQEDADSIAAIHRALDLGVNWIDTAPVYGLGHSEEVVARALAGLEERPYVFTKCSLVWDGTRHVASSLRRESIRCEVERSLSRLRLEAIDLLQIHWPQPDEEIEEGWSTLAELKREGKVRHVGVSNFSVDQLRRAQRIAPVETLQPPYSLLDRGVEAEVLPFCAEHRIGVIVWGPLAHGLLTGTWTRERVEALPIDDFRRGNNQHFATEAVWRNLELVERLKPVAARLDCSLGELAVAWTLRHPAVSGAIVGFRRPEQVEQVAGASGLRLDSRDLADLEAALAV